MGLFQEREILKPVKILAEITRLGVAGLAVFSESKHWGVPMPAIIASYSVDLALPNVVAMIVQRNLPKFLPRPLELSYMIGFTVCSGTELMQGLHLMRGTYDPYDILAFGIGTTGGYILDRRARI